MGNDVSALLIAMSCEGTLVSHQTDEKYNLLKERPTDKQRQLTPRVSRVEVGQ